MLRSCSCFHGFCSGLSPRAGNQTKTSYCKVSRLERPQVPGSWNPIRPHLGGTVGDLEGNHLAVSRNWGSFLWVSLEEEPYIWGLHHIEAPAVTVLDPPGCLRRNPRVPGPRAFPQASTPPPATKTSKRRLPRSEPRP